MNNGNNNNNNDNIIGNNKNYEEYITKSLCSYCSMRLLFIHTVHNDFIAIGALDTDDDVAGIMARMDATFENFAGHFIEVVFVQYFNDF